jgi:hypothetical protein
MTTNDTSTNTNTPAKKRGRKPKKAPEDTTNSGNIIETKILDDNINVIIEETTQELNQYTKNELLNSVNLDLTNVEESDDIIENNDIFSTDIQVQNDKPVAKKRGRKPKGGKIIQQIAPLNNCKEPKSNVILHLKCSIKDLYSNNETSEVQGFDFQKSQLSYNDIVADTNIFNTTHNYSSDINSINQFKKKYDDDDDIYDYDEDKPNKDSDIREIWKKIKTLEHSLHINNICDKKSACFWCTYDFDNPPIYIPKHFIKESYHVYGCFCSPECATAYLMEENIDSSAKFERYHLINHIYSKIYDYKKNIKPAPNPYYMLEKYYGNLTIQEYRSLLRNERLFLIVDKPLTRILPELHEDNDVFIINNKIIPSNTYQIKKKLQNKQTKTTILSEKFGLNP